MPLRAGRLRLATAPSTTTRKGISEMRLSHTLLRHGGMGRLFSGIYAPSTLGSFLRAFTFGHVGQLDAVASRFLLAPAGVTRLVGTRPTPPAAGERGGFGFVNVDDTVVEVHGHAKQGAG